jgi:riboflavin biosynthesis protein RibD
VARAVVAVGDPDPRVNGRGLAMLRAAGIAVSEDVCAVEAAAINAGFFLKVRQNRPLVTLKIAESLDGRITAASGESQWITGPQARAYGHLLRARHDGILAGINTVLADDPELTCRLPGLEHRSPIRIVLDSHLRLPLASKLVQTARALPVLVFTAAAGGEALKAAGVEVLRVPAGADGRPLLCEVLAVLAGRGLTRILVEGGAGVAAGFLSAGLADRLEVFSAPIVLGGGGRAAIESLSETKLCKAPRFAVTARRELGSDLLVSYRVED